ncbi:hypothetical protein IEQ34_019138 [Dendrobium chrysotoxum]|uniref:Uncharacterized protein n=1 Tax=Dendrobium chrysotoxum TaxID=161865 RepID=A0AAV7G7N0_DENCH|nr:hypothetical protein IEQ34_019138 [Dendrobium chrysotoxum]
MIHLRPQSLRARFSRCTGNVKNYVDPKGVTCNFDEFVQNSTLAEMENGEEEKQTVDNTKDLQAMIHADDHLIAAMIFLVKDIFHATYNYTCMHHMSLQRGWQIDDFSETFF